MGEGEGGGRKEEGREGGSERGSEDEAALQANERKFE